MAVVRSSAGPLLMLDRDLNVVAASGSFAEAFELDISGAAGKPLSSLGAGEWHTPQLAVLLEATRSGAPALEAYEMDLKRPGRTARRLVIHAQRLAYQDLDQMRLLVAVTDVTDPRANQRAKDAALAQNLVLLQEVRHRVANSLQIVASVLMRNARLTQSDETRGHLKDAHNRVMSVATLERQLAGSPAATAQLHAYFTSLCDSIAASMIADDQQILLTVTGSDGVVEARVSVSLGLILTELVINALKYAFPEGRAGSIVVDCTFGGANWTLSVTDDGIGMPADRDLTHVGLGTSIVQALAQQLEAVVEVTPANPGTRVAIVCTQVALVDEVEAPAEAALAVLRQRQGSRPGFQDRTI